MKVYKMREGEETRDVKTEGRIFKNREEGGHEEVYSRVELSQEG